MKPLRRHLKLIALLLSVFVMLQSCSVYQSYPTPVDEAINSSKKVKVKLSNDEAYKFNRLAKDEEGQLYGIAPKNSNTSKSLSNQIAEIGSHNQLVKILLENDQLKGIYLEDAVKKKSTIKVVIGIILLVGLVGLIASIANSDIYFPQN